MIRHLASVSILVGLSALGLACDKPGAAEEKKEVNASEQAATAHAEAAQKAANAQAQADKDIASAQADFVKAREDYRHRRADDLADLDKRVADLQAKDETATGKRKADLDTALPTIHAKRTAFADDMRDLDSASGSLWDQAKTVVDKEWDNLNSMVENLR